MGPHVMREIEVCSRGPMSISPLGITLAVAICSSESSGSARPDSALSQLTVGFLLLFLHSKLLFVL